ncbi:MAG: class I SAM-dependent methyltransferase, partial [Candidatus Omnitrophica bacterium]|nr:class I SAM-dependent methyltransferase [Candidatus Omnitrophota bacterium]
MDEIRRIRSVYKKREEQNKQVLYSLFQPGSLYIFQQRERVLLNELRKANLQELWSKKILDVGCGQGIELINFIRYGANPKNLFGIDLIRERIKSAESLSSYVNFSCGNATKLPYEDDCFDVVLQYTVFTSILDIEIKKKIAN